MHPHAALIERLYGCLTKDQIDHNVMASCYHLDATFEDIAFNLRGKKQIHVMWHMISETDLKATFKIIRANDQGAEAQITDEYTFGKTDQDEGRKVINEIRSDFKFQDGLIIKHRDSCNAWKWGVQALGPAKGALTWLVPSLRRAKAMNKLRSFIARHPEYA
jgi:hypothetical protein